MPKPPTEDSRYARVHRRLREERGSATAFECAETGCTRDADEWAYDRLDPREISTTAYGVNVTFTEDLTHYVPLCRSHHRLLDAARGVRDTCNRGHARTPENTYENRTTGKAVCRVCKREWTNRTRAEARNGK